jgi:outer membrane protein TolC
MINAAQARVQQAQAGSSPTVDGFAGYTVDQGSITGGAGDSWQAGVKLQYTLIDGHRTSSEVARASAYVAELQQKRHKLELAIGLEVEQARLALREADERLQVTEKTIAQAMESAEINRARFAEGLVLPSDLIAVENRLTEAMTRRTMAKTARQIAIADLRHANGLPQFDDLPRDPQ